MSLTLGQDPEDLNVVFVKGVSWWVTLDQTDEMGQDVDFDEGDVLSLQVGDSVYDADIEGAQASWFLDADEVNTLIASAPTKSMLILKTADDKPIPWALGGVTVRA